MCYSLWYNAPAMLTAGSLEAETLPPFPRNRPALQWVHYTTSCNTQSSTPEDGRDQNPNHVEPIGIINKPLLCVELVVYIIYINYVRSNKYQIWRVVQHNYKTFFNLIKLQHLCYNVVTLFCFWQNVAVGGDNEVLCNSLTY